MSSWRAGSFWLCCFWQVVRRLWSCTCPGSPVTCTSVLIGMSTWPAGSFCLSCFWQVVRHLWSLQVSGIHHHTDLHPGRNVYLTSWFILSGCFLTGRKTFVVPTCVSDLPAHGCPPQKEPLPNQLVHSVSIVFDRQWDVCGPYTCLGSPITRTSTLIGMSSWPAGSLCLCFCWQVVRHLWSLPVSGIPHHTDLYPIRNVNPKSWFILSVLFLIGGETSVFPTRVWDLRSTVMLTSTPVAMSTQPAGSFCLSCFWQAVRHLWSIHMSWIPHHTDLHPMRNIYLTSRFILSVLLLTGGDMSVVPTCVCDLLSLDLHPSRNLYLTSWFILSVLLFRGNQMSVVPTHVWDPPSHRPPAW